MDVLRTASAAPDPQQLLREHRLALFLDFDGTLVPIAEHPDRVQMAPQLPPLLRQLAAQLNGALAIVTGRQLASLDRQLAPLVLPAAGMHGAELRLAADAPVQTPSPLGPAVERLAARYAGDAALWIEDKGAAVAMHYRAAPQRRAEAEAAMRALQAQCPHTELIAGKDVYELRPRGVNKGAAVKRFMDTPGFAGRFPLFIGDDVTDEDGIAAAQRHGGLGIKVGAGNSAARARLDDPGAVLDWLAAFAAQTG